MTDDDLLRRAREALEGITPGPWRISDGKRKYRVSIDGGVWDDFARVVVRIRGVDGPVASDTGAANARFIAAARDLVPEMAARIRELEAERDAALAQQDRIARAAYELAAEAARDWFYDPEADAVTDERLAGEIRAIDPAEAIERAKEVGE